MPVHPLDIQSALDGIRRDVRHEAWVSEVEEYVFSPTLGVVQKIGHGVNEEPRLLHIRSINHPTLRLHEIMREFSDDQEKMNEAIRREFGW